ncbi:MAG: uracil-DNA glycosylase [Rhodospirillaceae bacterium]
MTESRTPETAPTAPFDAAAVLRWYAAAGVDIAVGETPLDRTAPPPAAPQPAPPQQAALRTEAAPRAAAADAPPPEGAATLDDLRARLESFDACLLRRTATRTVFGAGPADARLMVIGEAPGADEDRSGVPFVGRAGQLLDKMLASIGWPREAVYITNVVPWRPPGNRNPTPEEVTLCLPFVLRAIDLVAPQAVLLLGGSAAAALLDSHDGITRLRGRWHTLARPEREIAALPTFHPAFLLRNPSSKAAVWRDLLGLKARIGTAAAPRQ